MAIRTAKEVEKHLRSKWDVEVQTSGSGDDDGKQVRSLNKKLTRGAIGVEYASELTAPDA